MKKLSNLLSCHSLTKHLGTGFAEQVDHACPAVRYDHD